MCWLQQFFLSFKTNSLPYGCRCKTVARPSIQVSIHIELALTRQPLSSFPQTDVFYIKRGKCYHNLFTKAPAILKSSHNKRQLLVDFWSLTSPAELELLSPHILISYLPEKAKLGLTVPRMYLTIRFTAFQWTEVGSLEDWASFPTANERSKGCSIHQMNETTKAFLYGKLFASQTLIPKRLAKFSVLIQFSMRVCIGV